MAKDTAYQIALEKIQTAYQTNSISLDLGGLGLTEIPEVITQLTYLEFLYLTNNQLTRLPKIIAQLTHLKSLSLSNNKLTEIPEIITQLSYLESLYLDNNRLKKLPRKIAKLKRLKRLVLKQNPLPIPEEIIRKGRGEYPWQDGTPKVIIDYYLEYLAKGKYPLNEAKVILVGQGTVGKTSLVKRLCAKEFDSTEKKTDGITISNLELDISNDVQKSQKNVRLNIWDFGGLHA